MNVPLNANVRLSDDRVDAGVGVGKQNIFPCNMPHANRRKSNDFIIDSNQFY